MPTPKLTGDLLSGNLLNVRCLIGEAEDALAFIARENPPAKKMKNVAMQARADLSRAAELLEAMMDELAKNPSSN